MRGNKFSCTMRIREDTEDWLDIYNQLKDGSVVTDLQFRPYGDKYWFLPLRQCKAEVLNVCYMGNGVSVDWHTDNWELIQDERWFARLLRWLYIDVWLWLRSIYKRM